MKRFCIGWIYLSIVVASANAAEPAFASAAFFQPFQTDRASLSPDGRHLAYPLHRGEKLYLALVNLETNASELYPISNDEVEDMSGRTEKTRARLTYLNWVTDKRLVACLQDEVVFAIDADGKNYKQLVGSRDLRKATAFKRREFVDRRPKRVYGTADKSSRRAVDQTLGGSVITGQSMMENSSSIGGIMSGSNDDEMVSPIPGRSPFGRAASGVGVSAEDEEETGRDFIENEDSSDLFDEGEASRFLLSPQVLQLPADDPDHIIVEARGRAGPLDDGYIAGARAGGSSRNDSPYPTDVNTSLFKVNIHTGKLALLDSEYVTSRMLSDKQGRLRLTIAHSGVERDFKIAREPDGRLVPMSKLSPMAESLNFALTPQNFLGQRSFPLGFDYDPNVLYYASNVGRDTYGIYAFDLKAGKRTDFAFEAPQYDLVDLNNPLPDDVLVFDRHQRKLAGLRYARIARETRWLDPELRALQGKLEKEYPNAQIEILEWDRARTRFLVSSFNQADSGGFYLFEKASGKLVEHVRRAPWLGADQMFETLPFEVRRPKGGTVSGYFTLPKQQRLNPVPLLVYCHDGPWTRDWPEYNRGVQALAAMGFAVAQVNYSGSAGFGLKHLNSLRAGYDRAALDDILTVMNWLQADKVVHPSAVAILGNGFGGYLALRALQLHPDRFRCGVSINAPSDLPAWLTNPAGAFAFRRDVRRAFFDADTATLDAISPLRSADKITKPLLIVRSGLDAVVPPAQSLALERALDKTSLMRSYRMVGEGHARWLPGSHEKLFTELVSFLNETVYSYNAKLGEAIKVENFP